MLTWNRPSYHRRLFAWLVAYSLLMVGCLIMFQSRRERQFKAGELNARLQTVNSYILAELDSGIPPAAVRLFPAPSLNGLRISIVDRAGKVTYDNTLDTLPQGNHLSRREIADALTGGSGYALRRHSESTGQTYFYSATRGSDGTIVRTALPYSPSLTGILKADYSFLWVTGGITLIMCVVGFFATRRLGQNIRRLSRFAERAERGEPVSDTPSFPHDELGDISSNIVRLYAQLQKATTDRDREHRAAMHQHQEKERIKKQLTNNINHELKTPVTAIRVCLETLLTHRDLPAEKREEFLERCLANSDRLRRLLDDVSQITRLDDGRHAIGRTPLDLAQVINEVRDELAPLAAGKGMSIILNIPATIPVNGNRQFLASIFHNLISNAIAYSGGDTVTVDCAADSSRLRFSVSDNGAGVAPEHLPHIFERFYRIDKGRSRAAGGTGLGLAIVKNAVLFHGGKISASSRPGQGLTVTFTLSAGN